MPTLEVPTPTPVPGETSKTHAHVASKRKTRGRTIWQFLRFGLVGCLNTTIDLLVLNCLLQLWPMQNIARLLLFNTIAYAFGALNSFVLNRYWTFQRTGRPKAREGARFLLMTLAAIACNDLLMWFMSKILHPVYLNPTLWTNISKVAAIGGTILVSYLGMRLWVFVQSSHEKRERFVHPRTWRHEELPDMSSQLPKLNGDFGWGSPKWSFREKDVEHATAFRSESSTSECPGRQLSHLGCDGSERGDQAAQTLPCWCPAPG